MSYYDRVFLSPPDDFDDSIIQDELREYGVKNTDEYLIFDNIGLLDWSKIEEKLIDKYVQCTDEDVYFLSDEALEELDSEALELVKNSVNKNNILRSKIM